MIRNPPDSALSSWLKQRFSDEKVRQEKEAEEMAIMLRVVWPEIAEDCVELMDLKETNE